MCTESRFEPYHPELYYCVSLGGSVMCLLCLPCLPTSLPPSMPVYWHAGTIEALNRFDKIRFWGDLLNFTDISWFWELNYPGIWRRVPQDKSSSLILWERHTSHILISLNSDNSESRLAWRQKRVYSPHLGCNSLNARIYSEAKCYEQTL